MSVETQSLINFTLLSTDMIAAWLGFMPPTWYLRRVERSSAGAAA